MRLRTVFKAGLMSSLLPFAAACTTTMSPEQFSELKQVVSSEGNDCMSGKIQTTPNGRVTGVERGWDENCDAQRFVQDLIQYQLYTDGKIDTITAATLVSMSIESNETTKAMIDKALVHFDLTIERLEELAVAQIKQDEIDKRAMEITDGCRVTGTFVIEGVGSVNRVECDDKESQKTVGPLSHYSIQIKNTQFRLG